MINRGSTLTFHSGLRYKVGEPISHNAQFRVFRASQKGSGERGVIKLLLPGFDAIACARRTQYLVGLRLPNPPICAPTDAYVRGKSVAHFAPLAAGVDLEEFLPSAACNLVTLLQLALVVVHGLSILESYGIAHGDIHAGNIKLDVATDGLIKANWIDLDNFIADGQPPPGCIGQHFYLAPELRAALVIGAPATPSIETDRFAAAVLLHEIILLRHPATSSEATDEFDRTMTSGRWPDDPVQRRWLPEIGGYPARILNPSLARLFRSGFSLRAEARPAYAEWESALKDALFNCVDECTRCGRQFIVDSSKAKCPYDDCDGDAQPLCLRLPNGREIRLNGATVELGRANLGGSPHVSGRHATVRRRGMAYVLQPCGSNGTFRRAGAHWQPIPQGELSILEAGDRLRFADVEVSVTA